MTAPEFAHALLAFGVPVIVCRPNPNQGKPFANDPARIDARELLIPSGWSTLTAAECDLSSFQPGIDALAMVGGHGVDVVDVDTKDGGSVENLPRFRSFGKVNTPSEGAHYYVVSTGVGKMSPLETSAGHVGDYVGGTVDGGGRLLAFLPGSTRPKYPGKAYEIASPLDLEALTEHDPDDELLNALMSCGGSHEGTPGKPAAPRAEVEEFLSRYSELPEDWCHYGRTTIDALEAEAASTVRGDPIRGRHAWAVRSATRAVELVRTGCASAEDLHRLEATLHEIKPEGGTDWGGCLAWAITNADGEAGCGLHGADGTDDGGDAGDQAVPRTLGEVHQTFRRWLGDDYDTDVLDAVLCVAAAEQLPGDPAWLLVVSGSGAAKTETVQALALGNGYGALVTSTISSEGALLSGTSSKERTKDATGGLLRKIGVRGVLVIKDVTSILSMNRETRGAVLAALREVYDGKWERNIGSDGGRTLTWNGRLAVIGAVTTAWDAAHSVVAAMGDRFLLVRLDSGTGRQGSGRQAIRNTGAEETMRTELAEAVGGVLSGVDATVELALTDAETDRLLALADVVTLARTAVERDYRGDVIDAHAPEMPTRFAKQLTQVVRGGLAIGMSREEAMRIACRCARDSAPPLRLAVLLDVLANPDAATHEVRQRLEKPRATVDRELQALHMLGLLTLDEIKYGDNKIRWIYRIADGIDTDALASMGDRDG